MEIKLCPKCQGQMTKNARISEDVTHIEYRYWECRCGFCIKFDGEEFRKD